MKILNFYLWAVFLVGMSGCKTEEGKIDKAYECCKRVCDESIERNSKVTSLDDPDLDGVLKEELEKENRTARIEYYSLCRESQKKCLDTLKTEPELWKDVWKNHCDKLVDAWKEHHRIASLDDPDLDRELSKAFEQESKKLESGCYSCCGDGAGRAVVVKETKRKVVKPPGEIEQAKVDGTKMQMHNIEEALDAYKIRAGSYPSTEESLQVLVTQGVMNSLPKDMWGNEFQYVRHNSRSYTIKSFGADGTPGGDGFDKDMELSQ